jgi:hypothetical protein
MRSNHPIDFEASRSLSRLSAETIRLDRANITGVVTTHLNWHNDFAHPNQRKYGATPDINRLDIFYL